MINENSLSKAKMFMNYLFNQRNIQDFSLSIGASIFTLLSAPYMIPTSIRSLKEKNTDNLTYEVNRYTQGGFMYGSSLGVLLTGYEIAYYLEEINKGNLEIMVIPLMTNLVSGLYESLKHYKKL